jgi:hypothetical protein
MISSIKTMYFGAHYGVNLGDINRKEITIKSIISSWEIN